MRRTRIADAIDVAAARHPLTVVTAPSGYGKTIAVAEWARSGPPRTAWLSLSSLDDDPGRLAQGVVHALLGALGEDFVERGLDPEIDEPSAAHRAVCDALEGLESPVRLVIDDAQRAGENWQSGVLGHLAEQAPDSLRVVLVGTSALEVSLSRLALTSPDAFIGAGDLAFDEEEVAQLVALHAPDADADRVFRETRGWPIAVRLLLVGGATGVGESRFHGVAVLQDYVRDHVLRALPEDLATFALESSVCRDVTPELARAVTGGGQAGALLEECVRKGLFLSRYETPRGPVYRWHAIFARQCTRILESTDPARVQELHRRAAAHLRHEDPLASISHSRFAHDQIDAITTLVASWIGLIVGPSAAAVERLCTELADPSHPDARLTYIRACALDVMGRHRVSREVLASAEENALVEPSRPDARVERVRAFAHLFLADGRAEAAAASDRVRALLADAAGAMDVHELASIHYLQGWAEIRHRTSPSYPIEYFEVAALESRSVGDGALERRALGHLAFAFTWAGRLSDAARTLDELGAVDADEAPWSYYAGGSAAAAAGYIAYWRGDQSTARREFAKVVAGGSSSTSFAGVARMMIAFATAETGDASACRRAGLGVQEIPLTEAHGVSWRAFRDAAVAMLEETAGDHRRAVRIAQRYADQTDLPVVCVALAGILRRHGDLAAAAVLLNGLRAYAALSYVAVPRLLTAALLSRRAGNLDAAHDLCESALVIAAPEQLRLPFMSREQEVRSLVREHLRRGSAHADFAAECLVDRDSFSTLGLTERELDVYALLQTERTMREIAGELGVSLNTVKTHQRSIYRKLGVGSRREAVRATIRAAARPRG